MAKNKVIFGGNVLIDLTTDTAQAAQILSGYTAHINTGEQVTGTCDYDADTSDANALVSEILNGRTAYVNGQKLTGDMANNGAVSGIISTRDQTYTVPQGYHDGSGAVQISQTERAKIIPQNIKAGISILSIEGEYSGEGVTAQAKTVTPTVAQQVVLPDSGYDYLSQVTVNGIPYVETQNAYGTTVTIG